MVKQLIIYGGLILLTLISWAVLQLNQTEQTIQHKAPAHNPDFFSIGYSKLELDENGRRKNLILAEKLIHYHDDESIEMDKPVIRTFVDGKFGWQIKANKGWLSADNENFLLRGNVNVNRRKLPDRRGIYIKTESLKIKPKKNYAETDEWVVINSKPDRTEGVGMQIYFAKPIHLKLLTQVKGKYVLE